MSEQSSNIVSKVWGLCNPLRDDGVSYGDYLEQLTYLIFLKMSDEYSRPPYKRETGIPKGYTWSDMNTLKGAELENQYRAILERLGDEGGILGQIFKGAVNKISNVSILYRVVQMIDKENWVSMSSDVKGEIYEGLLQKNAQGPVQLQELRAAPDDAQGLLCLVSGHGDHRWRSGCADYPPAHQHPPAGNSVRQRGQTDAANQSRLALAATQA